MLDSAMERRSPRQKQKIASTLAVAFHRHKAGHDDCDRLRFADAV